jgi:hypothetical protein
MKYGLHRYYPELFMFDADADGCFSAWNGISDYDVTKSRYYTDGNETLYIKCFAYVLDKVPALCAKYNVRTEALFSLGVGARFHWYPFRRALFYNRPERSERVVKMSGGEIYYYRNGRWTVNTVAYDSDRKELAGYLLKKIEVCLRRAVKYKYQLKSGRGIFIYEFEKLGIPFEAFDHFIELSVSEFYRDLNKTIVTVDRVNLARIREESLETQDKLVVPEDGGEVPSFVKDADIWEPAGFENPDYDPGDEPRTGWETLVEALSDTERGALDVILRGGAGIRAYADEKGVMLEVLADGINEKAIDHVGDNLLEIDDGIILYDEYREKVGKALAHSRNTHIPQLIIKERRETYPDN